MKLKGKLIGALTTFAISAGLVTTLVSCKGDDSTKTNNVLFEGDRVVTPQPGAREAIVTGFKLEKTLDETGFDAIGVKSTNSNVTAAIVEGETPKRDFSVKLTIAVEDANVDKKEDFGLIFGFYKDATVQKQVRISSFVFNYLSAWKVKEVQPIEGKERAFNPKAGEVVYSTTNHFQIANGDTLKDNEELKLELVGPDANKFISHAYITNEKFVNITLEATQIDNIYKDQDFQIGFKFSIWYDGTQKWTKTFGTGATGDAYYIFHYTMMWDAPTVSVVGHDFDSNIDIACDKVTHVKYLSDSSAGTGFKLSKALLENETLDVSIKGDGLNVTAELQDNRQWIDLDIQIVEDSTFNPYLTKDFPFILTFIISHPGYANSECKITSHNIRARYTGKDEPKTWAITFPTYYRSYSGEKRISLVGNYILPEGTWPAETPLKSITLDPSSVTGSEGSTIAFDTTEYSGGYEDTYLYRFATMYLNIQNKNDWYEAETFDLKFTLKFAQTSAGDTQTLDMHIEYVPYDDPTSAAYKNDAAKYIADRSLTVSCLIPDAQSLTNESHHSGTGWIVGDATPNDKTDRVYNVVTTWEQKSSYQKWIEQYSANNLYFGVCDPNMTMSYQDKDYCLIDEHMYYLKPTTDAITIMSDTDWADNFEWKRGWTFIVTSNGQALNACVLTIDFDEIATLDGQNIYRNYEHQRDIFNKLDKLEAYKVKTGSAITRLQSSTNQGDGTFYVAGAEESTISPFDDQIQHTAYSWHTVSDIQISTSESATEQNRVIELERDASTWESIWGLDVLPLGKDSSGRTVDWLTPGWKFTDVQSANWWRQDAALGSMLLSKDTNGWFVAGLYTGFFTTKEEAREQYYPRFDAFYGYSDVSTTYINILSDYNN